MNLIYNTTTGMVILEVLTVFILSSINPPNENTPEVYSTIQHRPQKFVIANIFISELKRLSHFFSGVFLPRSQCERLYLQFPPGCPEVSTAFLTFYNPFKLVYRCKHFLSKSCTFFNFIMGNFRRLRSLQERKVVDGQSRYFKAKVELYGR